MRRVWLFWLLAALLPLTAVHAQVEGWSSGCDSAAVPAIAATTSHLDYSAACQQYLACRAANDDAVCQMQTLLALESSCADDPLCRLRARLYAAAISMPDPTYASPFTLENAADLPPILISALTHFESGDYAAAGADYQSITTDISYHPLIPLSMGLAAEAGGDAEAARRYYDNGISQVLLYPFAYYVRGDFLARSGAVEEAAADFENLRQSADAYGLTLPEELKLAYPISLIAFEQWLAYPVFFTSGSTAGSGATDESLMEAQPVEIAIVSDGTRLITHGLGRFLGEQGDIPAYLNFAVDENGGFYYDNVYTDDYGTWGDHITMTPDLPMQVAETVTVFEASASARSLLAPADQPDPRSSFDVTRCEDGALSRVSVGMGVHGYFANTIALYDTPGGTPTGDQLEALTILEGPQCVGDQVWWRVQNANDPTMIGWAAENEGTEYRIASFGAPGIPPMRGQ